MKELVTLRQKPMKNGGSSLFLDYTVRGLRHKEYLQMYLSPETSKLAKLQNAETLKAAEVLRAKKTIELQNGEAGIRTVKKDVLLTDFLEQMRDDYEARGHESYAHTVGKVITWLKRYGGRKGLQDLDADYFVGFYNYLRRRKDKSCYRGGRRTDDGSLGASTINNYYAVIGTQLNTAVRRGLIPVNPQHKMELRDRPKAEEAHREYLTLDEIRRFAEAPCKNETAKGMFLFSCFTGLRISDCLSLRWSDIREEAQGRVLEVRQVKTHAIVRVPLGVNAEAYLPQKTKSPLVFWDAPEKSDINRRVQDCAKAAGITKHISFHCARHTYATLLLTYGADLYTVSKLLGHHNVTVTQVYGKIVDNKKVEAVNLIPALK